MSFNSNSVQDDPDMSRDADASLKRVAGAQVIQDIAMGVYYANTQGTTHKPGSYDMLIKELEGNLGQLLDTKMSYRQIEEYLNIVGYDSNDIRQAFQKVTGVDPVQVEFLRLEDLKATPGNIPGFNCGWGLSKEAGTESYFIMQDGRGLFVVYAQKNDQEREEAKAFLRQDEAMKYLKGKVKELHRYDVPALEAAEEEPNLDEKEPTSKFYTAVANQLYDLEKKGALADEFVHKVARDMVTCGNLTEFEGQYLIRKYADQPNMTPAETVPVQPAHADDNGPSQDEMGKTMKNVQDNKSVGKEIRKRTPQDFFKATLPDRIEEIATEHIEDVLSYIANREADIDGFGISLHSLQYQKNDAVKTLGDINPQTGEPSGPPRATISAILEIENKTMASEKNKKFVLAVFFVNANGQISTSDSVKGEDDIIFGFTTEGMEQYFRKATQKEVQI